MRHIKITIELGNMKHEISGELEFDVRIRRLIELTFSTPLTVLKLGEMYSNHVEEMLCEEWVNLTMYYERELANGYSLDGLDDEDIG